jgi:hypothetical protein
MAKRASKPKDPRTKEEVAAQKKTKGLKQPAIAKARKEVAKEKEEKKAKGAAIEAAAAPRRKKSSPSAPKTSARGDAGPLDLDRPEPAKPAKREKAEDVPQVRQAVKRSQESKRLAQIGNADSLTTAERLGMQEMSSMPIQEIKKEAPLASDPLRPKPEPLPESVRSPFATGGAYTFDAPDRALSAPAGKAQSTDESSKVSKDLARRVKKGIDRGDTSLNLPGTPSVRERALEIAVKAHARAVERGEAHPLDVPTDTTPEVTTGHPMRQAIVEAGFNANESKLRSFASAKGMKFEDAVHGLYKTAQIQTAKDAPVNARVRKNKESGLPELYDAKHETPPTTGFDVDLLNYLGADIHRKEGPKPAIEPRDRPRLKAQNILEELTGAKRSGEFSGRAKGGVTPFGPQEIDESLNRTAKDDPYRGDPRTPGSGKRPTGDIATSGAGKYAPEQVKDLPKPPGKKAKAFGGATDSMGGAIPGPTKNPRISRSDRGRRQTPASSPTYRLSSAPPKEVQPTQTTQPRSTQFEQLDMFSIDSFPKLSKPDFQTRREMEEVVVKLPERKLDVREVPVKDSPGKTVKTTALPEPIKLSDKAAREELSSRQRAMYGMTGAGAFSFGTTVTPAVKALAPKKLRGGGEKVQEAAPKVSSGVAYTQPFLEPSLSQAKLAEKFPQDYAKTDSAGNPKKQNVWNMMSRQFLPGKEVEASPATKALQSQANMLRGKKDTMFEPPKSDATNIDKV